MTERARPFLLVLYCSAGGGHRRAAEAIAEEWEARTGGRAELVNYFARFASPFFDAVTTYWYFRAVQYAPKLVSAFYGLMGRLRPDSLLRRAINRQGMARFRRYLAHERPEVVCCVHWTFAGTMSDLRRNGLTSVPCLTVITDYVSHPEWLHPGVDRYCVAHALVRDGVQARGIPSERIAVSGIPVRRQFAAPHDRNAVRARLGLAQGLPVILVMAGAYAMLGSTGDIVKILTRFPRPIQTLVVCGHAPRLADRVRAAVAGSPHRFEVFGYVDNVADLMAAADVLITKAGGVTVSEALAMHLPMLIYGSIPGQEESNTDFLIQHGAALAPGTPAEIRRTLEALCADPDGLAAMRLAAADLGRPAAAQVVVAHLAQLTGESAPLGNRRSLDIGAAPR